MPENETTPSQETIENSIAIGKLVSLQERTTSDVDKLVNHIEKFLPVHTDISNIKKILWGIIAITTSYGAWITLEYHRIDNELAIQRQIQIRLNDQFNDNKNQITYLKGRIKK